MGNFCLAKIELDQIDQVLLVFLDLLLLVLFSLFHLNIPVVSYVAVW